MQEGLVILVVAGAAAFLARRLFFFKGAKRGTSSFVPLERLRRKSNDRHTCH